MGKNRIIKKIAEKELAEKILSLGCEYSYIDVDFNCYDWSVFETNINDEYYLMAIGRVNNKCFLERYNLELNEVQYYGKFNILSDINTLDANFIKHFYGDFDEFKSLNNVCKCDFARYKLANSLSLDIEFLSEALPGNSYEEYKMLSRYRKRKIIL